MTNPCYSWWDSLIEQEQYKLLLTWYPTEIKEDTDIEKFWGDLPEDTKWYIYERENNIFQLYEQEKTEIVGNREAHL